MGPSELARKAGISRETVRPLFAGTPSNSRPVTLAKVSVALGWPPNGIARLLDGESPEDLADSPAVPQPKEETQIDYNSRIARMPEHVRRTIEDLIDRFEEEERR